MTPPIHSISRRRFLGGTLAVAASAPVVLSGLAAETTNTPVPAPHFHRKLKLGLIGCGGRGSWIAKHFQRHGGYTIHAVADYFAAVADQTGADLGVDPARRFSTLSGYKRLLESGVEAVAIETPPYFIPEQAEAAVAAGIHVYLAKPVGSDVPGCLRVEAAGRAATRRQRCFLVDYQMQNDPANLEVFRRIRQPDFGPVAWLSTAGICGGFPDPARTANLESRLQKLIWVNDIAMGCDYLGNYDIHAIDAALWVLGERPVAASGASRICRPEPHGDSHDVVANVFEYASGVVHHHQGQALRNQAKGELSCRVYGASGQALLNYWGAVTCKTKEDGFTGEATNVYEAGAVKNIATFHHSVTEGRFENDTLRRSVDGALACVLGREAAHRRCRLTMTDLIKENRRLEMDLKGLKT